uniref:Uncharacterized protein n=1 Tax=Panagrolaimus davidi TaxID=227884 RepID=A0A914PAJ8_9BILA
MKHMFFLFVKSQQKTNGQMDGTMDVENDQTDVVIGIGNNDDGMEKANDADKDDGKGSGNDRDGRSDDGRDSGDSDDHGPGYGHGPE